MTEPKPLDLDRLRDDPSELARALYDCALRVHAISAAAAPAQDTADRLMLLVGMASASLMRLGTKPRERMPSLEATTLSHSLATLPSKEELVAEECAKICKAVAEEVRLDGHHPAITDAECAVLAKAAGRIRARYRKEPST